MFWKKKNKTNADAQQNGSHRFELDVVIKTDLGNIRTNNEDAARFVRMSNEEIIRQKGYLLMVADGMGGHNAGEVASRMAIDIISEEYFKTGNGNNYEKLLGKAFNQANKKILSLGTSSEAHRGMGTTCTALVIVGQNIYYAHAGDSRAYLYKNKLLSRITEDHTYVQELVKNGDITAAEADTHPQRNILTNAMGTKPELRVDTGKFDRLFELHDRILICSDGLYDYFNDEQLTDILNLDSLDDAADLMIDEAKRRGGHDNITIALAEKKEAGSENKTLKSTRDVELPVN